jgi:hypothetical protein
VAYVRGRSGSWSLWCGPVDDLQKAAIVGDWRSGYCSNARFHPDGQSIYTLETVQQRGVWKNDLASGKRERIIPTPATSMALDPFARLLAFSAFFRDVEPNQVSQMRNGSWFARTSRRREPLYRIPSSGVWMGSMCWWPQDGGPTANRVVVDPEFRRPRKVLVPAAAHSVYRTAVDLWGPFAADVVG